MGKMYKNLNRVKMVKRGLVVKVLVIMVVGFLVRMGFSCCRCPEQVREYRFDHLFIENINNADWTADRTDWDVMHAAAVAFRVTLVDSSFQWFEQAALTGLATNSVMAMEPCWCPWHIYLEHPIEKLSILTLRDFSPDQPAGSDLVDLFVWQTGWNHLYQSIDSLLPRLNESWYTDFIPEKTVDFFCKEAVQTDSLQLVFRLHYANGEVLADTTGVIAILHENQEVEL